MSRGIFGLFLLAVAGCASAPPPSAKEKRIAANPHAVVTGTLRRASGSPAAGIRVRGVPLDWDIPWLPAAEADAQGRFRLELAAPGEYAFLLFSGGRSVMSDDPRDPGRQRLSVEPGGRYDGVELVYLEELWRGFGDGGGVRREASSRATTASILAMLPAARSANPAHAP